MRALAILGGSVLCALVLTSCGLLSFGRWGGDDEAHQLLNERMQAISDAVNAHDAGALKAMFSPAAVEQAPDIDAGVEYLLSLFPAGGVTWTYDHYGYQGDRSDGHKADLFVGAYDVAANGSDYSFFIAEFTLDEANPDRVGLFAMGAALVTDQLFIGPSGLFRAWQGGIHVDETVGLAYPGVYVPDFDNPNIAGYVMRGIVEELDSQDGLGLEESFSGYARNTLGPDLESEVDALLALFPEGEVDWDQPLGTPVVRYGPEAEGETVLLLSTYPVSSGGKDFWVSSAHFSINATDHSKEGIYAIGVAPRTPSGDSGPEVALFTWLDAFDVAASAPPGVFIAN